MGKFKHTDTGTIPRWLQIPIGLVLCVFLMLCFAGSVALVVSANERAPIVAAVLGSVMALACIWLFAMSVRLILGKTVQGGLMGPRALRLFAWFFLLIPPTSILTGAFFDHPVRNAIMSVAYTLVFLQLRRLASEREREPGATKRARR